MKSKGFDVLSMDMANDYGYKITLGVDRFPLFRNSVDIVLANYVFMFLTDKETARVLKEIKRVAKSGCKLVVELYPAKDSYVRDDIEAEVLLEDIWHQLGWLGVKWNKLRFIGEKP